MEIGVFGGTFNPVHLGHLRAAEEVCDALGLQRVIFVPARIPPHKLSTALSPPAARLEMVRLAVSGNPRFEVSDQELRRDGPSYSVDTLRELRAGLVEGDRLWFLVGADAFREIHTWRRFPEIFHLADIAVMRRPPESGELPPPLGIEEQFSSVDGGFRHHSGREVRFVPVTLLDISSTEIRRALSAGRSVRYLVPDSILPSLEARASEPSSLKEADG